MIVHLAFTCCVLGLTIFNYYAGRRNILYPAFLFSLIWLVVFCIYMLPLVEVDKLGTYTLFVVVSGVISFSAGAAIVGWWTFSRPLAVASRSNSIFKKILFFCCLALLPGFVLEILRLSASGGLESFMISARAAIADAVTSGEKPYSSPIYTIAPMLAIFNAFIFLIEAREGRRERVWVWASVLMALSFSVLSTGRTWFLELVVGLVGIHLLRSRRFSAKDAWKFVRWPLVATLVLFSLLVLLNKDTSGENGGTTDALGHYVLGYTVIPLAGFDYVLHHPSEYKYDSNHTFKQALPTLARIFGFRYTPPPTLDDFVWVPLPTNVYTVFKYYYVDFGLSGMLVTMFSIGAGQTWLFQKALTGAHFYIFLFAISLYPLAMVAFDDSYSLILNNLVAVAFAALYFRFLRPSPFQTRAGIGPPRAEQAQH